MEFDVLHGNFDNTLHHLLAILLDSIPFHSED
jgi:hypothetical protein